MNGVSEKFALPAMKLAGNIVSGIGPHKKLMILIFHRVLSEFDEMRPGEITKKEFDWQMSLLSEYFNVVSLKEGIENIKTGKLPARAVAITFDDGYRDNYDNAFPILDHYKLPATIFVAAGYLNGGRMWNDSVIEAIRKYEGDTINLTKVGIGKCEVKSKPDRLHVATRIINKIKHLPFEEREAKAEIVTGQVESLPDDLMLSSDQVLFLRRNGIDIGGHTLSHPILAKLDDKTAEIEINHGKEILEQITREKILIFAYPNGRLGSDYLPRHIEMVKANGFEAAVTTNWGVGHAKSDTYQLPRFTPWDRSKSRFMARMIYMFGISK